MGLVKRPLYKRERPKARHRGDIRHFAPLAGLPDANVTEIASALFAAGFGRCDSNGRPAPVIVGRAIDYDPHKNRYRVIAKCQRSGRAYDFEIEGEVVRELILLTRAAYGGKEDSQNLVNSGGGLILAG